MTASPPPLDAAALRAWNGRNDRATDVVTPRVVQGLLATLDRDGSALAEGDPVPATAHWCLTPPTVPMSGLGPDGHPARGGFLPPVPLPRRMFAGSTLAFQGDLRVGDAVRRVSRIADVMLKEGRTGPLLFVAVENRIEGNGETVLEEQQDIVYRGLDAGGAAKGLRRLPVRAGDPRRLSRWAERSSPCAS
jgi:3-methylfumaryl-CoA hydratase